MGKSMFGQFFGVLMVIFIGWVFIASDPAERMDRACRPVEWSGNMAVSLVALTYPSGQHRTQTAFDNLDYGCQYSLWRLFYESDYLAAPDQGGGSSTPPAELPESE